MAKIRILRRQDKAYMELPPDISGGEEIELFHLREGYYLLAVPLPKPGQSGRGQISQEEKAVLKKLLSIRFENRTPAHVSKMLSDSERSVLRELELKGLVHVYRNKKYVNGVYSVNDSAYSMAKDKVTSEGSPAREERARMQDSQQGERRSGAIASLNGRGFIIITERREAVELSEQLNGLMKSGAVTGVKGFDGKFYIVTRDYYASAASRISSVLKEEMDPASIAGAAKIDPEGCIAVLRLMAENGDIIEKKKGIFAPV
jgi:hypothetical protein